MHFWQVGVSKSWCFNKIRVLYLEFPSTCATLAPPDRPAAILHKLVSIPPFHWLLSDILGQLPCPMQTCLGHLSAFVVEEPLSKSWCFNKIRVLTKTPVVLQQGLRPFLTLRLHHTHSLSSHSLVRTPYLNISLVICTPPSHERHIDLPNP